MALLQPSPPPSAGNSRATREKAGWRDDRPRSRGARWEHFLRDRKRTRWGNFTWISPAPLLASINDKIVHGLDDLVNAIRPRWLASMRDGDYSDELLLIDRFADEENFSFLVLGDPGEQDASQYAVVAPLLAKGEDTNFMVICSDVIYPAGDINDYIDGFYLPYRDYRQPILALPGNHDWYDGLNGFMFHFCGAEPLPPIQYRAGSYSWKERFAHGLWRKPSPPDLPTLLHERDAFIDGTWEPPQPGPYHAIETKRLLIVSIDTGITGTVDREQGEWLRRVSCDPRPKVLLTGKPIYVDGDYHPCEIDWGPGEGHPETVDDIVRNPDHNYVAAIGGDVHNYQRYSVTLRGEESRCRDDDPDAPLRTIQYIVSGGGGAYLSATHRFGRVDLDQQVNKDRPKVEPVLEEEAFWCYPLRGDSLARYTRRFAPGFGVALIGALLALAAVLSLFFFVFGGFDQNVGPLRHVEAWQAIYLTPLTLLAVAVILMLATGLSNKALPKGYRTLSSTTLAIALGALLTFVLNLALTHEDWGEVRRMMFCSLIAVAAPVLGVVGYYLLRDFIAPSVRAGIGLSVPIGLGVIVLTNSDLDIPVSGATLTCGALLTLWLSVLVIGHLRTPPGRPEESKLRLRLGQILPPLLGGLGLIALLYSVSDTNFIPAGVLSAFGALIVLASLAMLVIGWRGLLAAPWIFPGRVDPEKTARWLADKLQMEPVRDSAKMAEVDLKTRALASLTYKTWPFKLFMSELAEATSPPFFKNFLRIDVADDKMKVTAFGVSGWADEEEQPTVEDEVEIELRGSGRGWSLFGLIGG